jgi:hypothetical protein
MATWVSPVDPTNVCMSWQCRVGEYTRRAHLPEIQKNRVWEVFGRSSSHEHLISKCGMKSVSADDMKSEKLIIQLKSFTVLSGHSGHCSLRCHSATSSDPYLIQPLGWLPVWQTSHLIQGNVLRLSPYLGKIALLLTSNFVLCENVWFTWGGSKEGRCVLTAAVPCRNIVGPSIQAQCQCVL